MARNYRRRNYFINQELQGKMIFVIFLFSLLGVALFTLIFSLLAADNLTISYTEQQFRVGNTPSILINELLQANWLFILLGGGIVSVLMLFVSHAFAGPLYRFEVAFKGLKEKDLNQKINLRDKDVGQKLARDINEFASLFSADLNRLQELSQLLATSLNAGKLDSARDCQKEIYNITESYRLKVES